MAIFFRKKNAGKDAGVFLGSVVATDSIWPPWGNDDPFIADCFQNGINDLGFRCGRLNTKHLSRFIDYIEIGIGLCNWEEYFESVRKGDPSAFEKEVNWNEKPKSFDGGPVCLVRFEGFLNKKALIDLAEAKNSIVGRDIRWDLQKIINNFGCAINIARPGCFSFNPSDSESDRHRGIGAFNGFWRYIHTMNDKVGWPTFRQFSTPSVWDWYSKMPGVVTGDTSSGVSRALSIYTRLFRQHYMSDELQDIVWSVAGIESVLGESGYTIVGALKSKLKVIFPGIETAKIDIEKSIGKMYGIRSSLVHGSERLNGRFNLDEPKSTDDIHETFAACILLGLIQVAYQRKIDEFKFEHVFV
ncbi:hypothetical protein [Mesorhizobium sp. M7A.F.Ca.US.008.03.1.1]|uniref:hypothetical protein n=1 Tax=Mesorhizobium sp. M7A.F.Ca.US.008.03.1.1 TaxID=2496742 RepID=UPI000FCC1A70|nr:hypothetical protein [Mesorhizobium sp. M7A.F.Ca.US.008.03.1.1]RUW59822.1 hypothetical protein EOA16_20530 [Mesorhizobium sp. M7A.F.Ca.US.008.03.1.1]